METRELRYFVAVAEELHFGRAAERLGMAQPPLSRAIQQLERRLGVSLLDRGSRGVSLTEAGSVLLDEGRTALAAVDAAERRTRRAAPGTGEPGLVLVAKAGAAQELLSELLPAYAAEPGAVPVKVVLCPVGEQEAYVRDGRADVALLHLPFDSAAGLDTEELVTESQILVLPAGHPMSTRTSVRMADVRALPEPLPRWDRCGSDAVGEPGPQVHSHTQLLQLIALGQAIAVLPESARSSLTGHHAAVPVQDAPPVTTLIAWPPHRRSGALADLVRTATRLRPGGRTPSPPSAPVAGAARS